LGHVKEGKGMYEAILLAGGLGTRLRSVVPDLPKCMAPVAGKPFISYVLEYFQKAGVGKFILSLGYKHETIKAYLNDHYAHIDIRYSVEKEPLGTGGAIKMACGMVRESNFLVINGDTFFRIDPLKLVSFHELNKSVCTLSLKPMQKFDRYGVVMLNKNQSIQRFQEKQSYESGLINGGVYALETESFLRENLPEKFSFEKDYLEKSFQRQPIFGLIQDQYFIDIGIPEDYQRAQTELIQNI
jgi:D-glycero-alpha-D-manno-heptose 1-phosphate guanylyltransferase